MTTYIISRLGCKPWANICFTLVHPSVSLSIWPSICLYVHHTFFNEGVSHKVMDGFTSYRNHREIVLCTWFTSTHLVDHGLCLSVCHDRCLTNQNVAIFIKRKFAVENVSSTTFAAASQQPSTGWMQFKYKCYHSN